MDDEGVDDTFSEVFGDEKNYAARTKRPGSLSRRSLTLMRADTTAATSFRFRMMDWWNAPHFLVSQPKPTGKLFLLTLVVWIVPIALVVAWMLIPLGDSYNSNMQLDSLPLFDDDQMSTTVNSNTGAVISNTTSMQRMAAIQSAPQFGSFYLIYSIIMAYCAGR